MQAPGSYSLQDKASGTQLIQELIEEGVHGVTQYEPTIDKVKRMHSVTTSIMNGFVYVPTEADLLADYLKELGTFLACKHDHQALS